MFHEANEASVLTAVLASESALKFWQPSPQPMPALFQDVDWHQGTLSQ
jgi:hypothetical protein